MPWSATIAGPPPRGKSGRASRSAMFVTIWTWTHEWSVRPRRAALTPATCHHAFTCGAALTASMSWSSRRLPRVGARVRIAAIASAGAGRTGGRASASSSSMRSQGTSGGLPQLQPAAVVLDRHRALVGAGAVRGGEWRGLAGLQHDLATDLGHGVGAVHLGVVAAEHDAGHEAVGEGRAGRQPVAVAAEQVDVGGAQADRLRAVVHDPAEEEVVAGRAGDRAR